MGKMGSKKVGGEQGGERQTARWFTKEIYTDTGHSIEDWNIEECEVGNNKRHTDKANGRLACQCSRLDKGQEVQRQITKEASSGNGSWVACLRYVAVIDEVPSSLVLLLNQRSILGEETALAGSVLAASNGVNSVVEQHPNVSLIGGVVLGLDFAVQGLKRNSTTHGNKVSHVVEAVRRDMVIRQSCLLVEDSHGRCHLGNLVIIQESHDQVGDGKVAAIGSSAGLAGSLAEKADQAMQERQEENTGGSIRAGANVVVVA